MKLYLDGQKQVVEYTNGAGWLVTRAKEDIAQGQPVVIGEVTRVAPCDIRRGDRLRILLSGTEMRVTGIRNGRYGRVV